MILRNRDRKAWVTMDRHIFDNPQAKGEDIAVLTWLLSRPDNWVLHIVAVAKRMGWGRDKAYRVVRHLIALGYIKRETLRNDDGSIRGEVYTVYENPNTAEPDTDNQDTDEPDTANTHTYLDNDIQQDNDGNKDYYARTFDLWWDAYDRKVNRKMAWNKWRKLSTSKIELILSHTPEYVAMTPDITFRAHPTTYLNKEYYETPVSHLVGKRTVQGQAASTQANGGGGHKRSIGGLSPREYLERGGHSEDEISELLGEGRDHRRERSTPTASHAEGMLQLPDKRLLREGQGA